MLVRVHNGRGIGQMAEDANLRAIMDLPVRTPAAATSLMFQPGFRPVAGEPGAFTVGMAPAATAGIMDWLEKNKMVAYIGAGTLLMLAMMSGRRRR